MMCVILRNIAACRSAESERPGGQLPSSPGRKNRSSDAGFTSPSRSVVPALWLVNSSRNVVNFEYPSRRLHRGDGGACKIEQSKNSVVWHGS